MKLQPTRPHEAGLRLRMRSESRRLSSQHEQLDELFDAVEVALHGASVHSARAAFERFSDALEAHLSLEDSFYFPAIHGLRGDPDGKLAALSLDHLELRTRIRALHALLVAGDVETASERLDDLALSIKAHEDIEEKLIASVAKR